MQTSGSDPKGPPLVSQLENPTVTQTSRILASLVRESEQLSRAPLYDDDDICHDKIDTFKPWSSPSSNTDILFLIHFSGDEDLDYVHSVQSLLIYLVMSFLRNLLIINLIVDDTKWKVGTNRAPPRTESSVKQTALFNTIQTLISQGFVEKSQSPHYSQILMVPKPDGTFRMCVDYRALND